MAPTATYPEENLAEENQVTKITPPPGSRPPPGEDYYTLFNGCPIEKPNASLRIGNQLRGTTLTSDINLIEIISHITHERIPERVMHAKGSGAYGEFEVTHDISDITSAAFLNKVGKKTPLFSRFSTVAGERGSADSVRDNRGFAFKFYTEEGNLDWLFFSAPVFPIRDPSKFPSMTHAQKRNPQTNLKDQNMFWDFFNHHPEGYHNLILLFSDSGTPVSYRYADIFSINTYKFTKPDGSFHYVKIHMKTDQGKKNLTQDETTTIGGKDTDYFTKDLFDAIKNKNFPSWTVYAQVIPPKEAETYKTNIFDATHTVSQKDFPLIPFGKITLNRNAENYFQEVEQVAFSPTHVVPGWSLSPDPLISIRAFAYGSTQRYRLGVNHDQLPINRPFYVYNPTKRDGFMNMGNFGPLPNYVPSSFAPPIVKAPQFEVRADHEEWIGTVTDFESQVTEDDYVQPREFYNNVLAKQEGQQANLVYNVASDLWAADKRIRYETYDHWRKIDQRLGDWIAQETESLVVANDNNQEIPGIVVGGDILPNAPISGATGGEDTVVPEPHSKTNGNGYANGTTNGYKKLVVGSKEFRDNVQKKVTEGHLFNLVAKGLEKQ